MYNIRNRIITLWIYWCWKAMIWMHEADLVTAHAECGDVQVPMQMFPCSFKSEYSIMYETLISKWTWLANCIQTLSIMWLLLHWQCCAACAYCCQIKLYEDKDLCTPRSTCSCSFRYFHEREGRKRGQLLEGHSGIFGPSKASVRLWVYPVMYFHVL